ncbi:MAG: BMP family ABC transporter substrate-binding protein [Bilophila sp.]
MTGFRPSLLESVGFCLLWMTLIVLLTSGSATAAPHMGFVHLAAPSASRATLDASAGLFAEAARRHVQSRGIETVVAVATLHDAKQTIAALAAQGVEILVVSSSCLFDAARSVAPDYPDTLFFVRTDGAVPDTMSGYQIRSYEACYLAGVQAASCLQAAVLAAQADEHAVKPPLEIRLSVPEKTPTSTAEAYRNHNAFALGVRSLVPDAHVVLTQGDAPSLEQLMLKAVALNWNNVFASLLAQRRFGIWQGTGRTLWYGYDSGVIKVAQNADANTLAAAQTLAQRSPFSGPLYDNAGTLRVPKGTVLSDAQLIALDWYVAGISVFPQ